MPDTSRRVVVVSERVGTGVWCATLVGTTPGLVLVAWFAGFDDALIGIGQFAADVCLICADSAPRPYAARVRDRYPHVAVVLVGDRTNAGIPLQGVGLLEPSSRRRDLLEAIDVPRAAVPSSWSTDTLVQLSMREREVALLVADGLSNREIAHALSISVSTAKNHVHHVLTKLHVDRRTHVHRHVAASTHARVS